MKQGFNFFLVLLITLLFGCEKDDICSDSTPTTPHLVLRFYDIANPDETKIVNGLLAYALNDDDSVLPIAGMTLQNRDSIAIPLRTGANSTRFVLHKNYGIDNNGTPDDPSDDFLLGNPEIITVSYSPEDIYVSRACGFKTVFNSLLFNVASDGDNWIFNFEITEENVENENQAHIQIFH